MNTQKQINNNLNQCKILKSIDTYGDLMTTDEVMAFLGITRQTIYKYINEGVLFAKKIGKGYCFSKRQVMEFVEQ